jgi:UDP-hydrolysing UDP-N-acetyl-D-glucosamine 2-epimerase
MNEFNKRKILVAVTHRTPYGRLKPVMRAIQNHPKLELQVVVATPVFMHNLLFAMRHVSFDALKASLPFYIRARLRALFGRKPAIDRQEHLSRIIRQDGFPIHARLPLFLEGGNLATMTKSAAAGLLGLPEILAKLKPDVVMVHADRFEMLPVALAASFTNIPLAHTQGGDVSGTIDEMIRHTITKLAHIHFPATEQSRERILRMGEDPRYVFRVGCPTIDVLKNMDFTIDENIFERNGKGYGDPLDFTKPYLLVLQHPVTTEYERARRDMEETIAAIRAINMPTLFFWPNVDAGSDGASAAVREFLKNPGLPALRIFKHFTPEDFYRVLNAAEVAVGNSSSFIREGSYLGTPAVIVGSRQQGRERVKNVVEVSQNRDEIAEAIKRQLKRGRYPPSALFGDGNASERIAEILASIEPAIQKQFHEIY